MASIFDDMEKIHNTNKQVIKEDWQLGEEGVTKYDEYRKQLEMDATVKDFIPILVFSKLKEEYNR